MIPSSPARCVIAWLGILYGMVAASADIVSQGLILDLDADVGVSESGGAVTAWTNQAPGGGDLSTNRGGPAVVDGPNGHRAVRFDGGRGSSNAPLRDYGRRAALIRLRSRLVENR